MKKIIGIVAEYNPFHEGHLYHIRETKKTVGENVCIVCVMSGDYVQRGDWAVFPKHERAAEACRQGADLVIELPLPWCLSSAGYFAEGAVGILKRMGITYLSFGSESGNLDWLKKSADVLSDENTQKEIKVFINEHPECSYPSAVNAVLGNAVPSQPNDLLAVEYLRALRSTDILSVGVKRTGMMHDERGTGEFPSASEIRNRIYNGEMITPHIDPMKMNIACVSRLRNVCKEIFDTLPDCRDGLGQRLYAAIQEHDTLDEICMAAKTKRFTLTRVRRAALCAVLNVCQEDREGTPPYARVLAMNRNGQEFLAQEGKEATIPILTQPKTVYRLGEKAEHVFSLGSAAHDLYMLCFPEKASGRCGEDYRKGPVLIEK